jgi:hypothetical protein
MDSNLHLLASVVSVICIQLSFIIRFINRCDFIDSYCIKRYFMIVFSFLGFILNYEVTKSIIFC